MVDTARIILFLQCQMRCSYCCNEQVRFNSQFMHTKFADIDLSKYSKVCLSGGEPFLHKDRLYRAIEQIPLDKRIYIYTNGLKISATDVEFLKTVRNFAGFNIGLHTLTQIKAITPKVDELRTRYLAQDINYDKLLRMYPNRLNQTNLKGWKLDDCDRENEDRYLLTDYLSS